MNQGTSFRFMTIKSIILIVDLMTVYPSDRSICIEFFPHFRILNIIIVFLEKINIIKKSMN